MNRCPLGQFLPVTAIASLLLTCALPAVANDAAAVQQSLDNAQPGQVIRVSSASYMLNRPWVLTKSGAAGQPIVIRATTTGGAVITGKAGFLLQGVSNVVIEGFDFRNDNTQPAIVLDGCKDVRITRNTFHLDDRVAARQNWIHITGANSGQNRIDHNLFEQKISPGAFIAIDGADKAPYTLSEGDRIDHNHFRSIGADDDNQEPLDKVRTIRLGWSGAIGKPAKSVIEYNLFEKCRGDEELISVRSSGQSIRYNTFVNCTGHVSLRAGKDNIVEGNFFFGENRKGIGALKVNGEGHRIFNNYFEGMSLPAMVYVNGSDASGVGVVPRKPAKDVEMVFNTFVNCLMGTIHIGVNGDGKWKTAPSGLSIANNIIIGYGENLIEFKTPASDVSWLANIIFHAGDREKVGVDLSAEEVRIVFPKLRKAGGIWRINHNSPAVDIAKGDYDYVTTDIDGQPRSKSPDIGADEFDQTPIKLQPLTEDDVGIEADLE